MRLCSGPVTADEPTFRPGDRIFDLGPFAVHRVPENAAPVRLDRWVMKNVCSNWNATQKLIASKQIWIVPPQHTTDQHRKSVMLPRFRPESEGKMHLEPRSYVYFPKIMRPAEPRRRPTVVGSEPPGWLLKRVLYKDTDFLAINKPSGWSVQPGKHVGGMHLQRLLPTLQFGMDEAPRFVHRLSTELSGVILLARHKAAATYAKDMIRQRAFWERSFWGVACGRTPKAGTVALPLAQERRHDREVSKPRREDDGGAPALTEYRTVLYSPMAGGLSLLEMNPYTGRYHQTRAHCAFGLRAPLLGDPLYYELSNRLNTETEYKVRYHSEDARRERKELLGAMPSLHLHSRQLRLKTFAGKDVHVTAPLPEPMAASFEALGWTSFLRRSDREAQRGTDWDIAEDPHINAALAEAEAKAEADRPRRRAAAAEGEEWAEGEDWAAAETAAGAGGAYEEEAEWAEDVQDEAPKGRGRRPGGRRSAVVGGAPS